MARRSQCSDAGDNPLDPNYLPPHYREEYRLAIDALVEEDVEGYYKFLQYVDVVDFLSGSEIDYIHNSIQLPKQSSHPEQRYLDTSGDGSSDTYWPLHSDLDAPGLDLGWPQSHHFIGPTEVTTLVNPAAPDMPSIKEQARRLIKNAQMVIAVVMDMFTDVDIFADILNAAMRNVAVYLLLDEANVAAFVNMVNNCRVNLQSIQYLRVRTVSGIRYHCRTGKSFKGQMLDRFILTDCRAVLSGNYSFMWSYEKLHRCMAHLFLGQLVSTFDEEFRILFAQSEPLVIENMEDMTVLQKRPLPGERPLLRDTRKYRTLDTGHQDEWNRQPYEENMDWRMMQLKRQDTFHGPMDIYNRYPSPQSRMDPQTRLEPQYDQGPPRIMDSLAHKRHSFAEGGGPGRFNSPYGQQGLPEAEQQGRLFYRGQQHLHPRDEPDFGGYGQVDKFWNQDFNQEEPYPEPGYSRDPEPHEGYDPVLNYLSSTRNVEVDQSSDRLIPGADLPYSTTHPRRHNISQTYACQTSPTPSNTTEKKYVPEHSSDRKDPTVKKGLRNWRISSYLSTYDSSGEPEGLPMGQGQTVDPFDDMPVQQPTPPPPATAEVAVPKIPNVREFKVPALPRASQMPAFAKTASRDFPKRFSDDVPQITPPVLVDPEPRVTPTPSESSSTADGEKQEEPEQREPITSTLRRDDSFRRNFNAAAVLRSSRLRSSLIFSSLDQNTNQDNTEQEDDKTKAENEPTKLPFVSQVLTQRRSGVREPFEWRNYIKSTDAAKAEEDGGKQAEKDSESKLEGQDVVKSEVAKSKEVAKIEEAAKSPQLAPKADKAVPKPSQTEETKIEQSLPPTEHPTKALLSEPFVDMNDPDQRFLFFKELAAKRKAAKAAEEAKLKQESASKDRKDDEKKGDKPKEVLGSTSDKSKEDSKKVEVSGKMDRVVSGDKKVPVATQSCEKIEAKVVTKDNEPRKVEKTLKDAASTQSKEGSKKTDTRPAVTQSCEVTTDSEKIKAKQSQVPHPTSTDIPTQDRKNSQTVEAPKSPGKQKPTEANVSSASAAVENVTEETQSATTTSATSNDPQLKTCRSVPDFAKSNMSDLLSSLPSARISERTLAQEANKDAASKPRLWTPSLHRRASLKSFGDKATGAAQTEEAAKEANQTAGIESKNQEISSVKSQTGEKTESKRNQDAKGEIATLTQLKDVSKDSTQSQSVPSETSQTKEKTEPAGKQSITKKDLAKTSTSEESKKPSQPKTLPSSDAKSQVSQNKEAFVKPHGSDSKRSGENPSQSQSILLVEQPKINQPEQEKCTDKQVNTSVKPLQTEKMAEKTEVVEHCVTKEASPKADPTAKENKLVSTTPSGKDGTKETSPLGSVATPEAVEQTAESVVITSKSKDPEKLSSVLPLAKTEQEGPATLPVDEAKQKFPSTWTEDFTILESHSNTSSPASYSTALEFISSEDSDMLSPARTDPQHLFKSGRAESSVSDMSDFETPNSDLSMSPMPFSVNMDDTIEDNVSIAETVIEAASRRKSEKVDGGVTTQMQEALSEEGPQIDTPKERLSPETGTKNLDAATSQSEATTKTNEAGTSTAKSDEVAFNTQVEGKLVTEGSPVSSGSSQVEQEAKIADKAIEITSESSVKEKADPTSKGSNIQSEASKESISTDVKTQDMNSQSGTNAELSKETLATSGDTKGTKMNKTAKTTDEPGKESIDVKGVDQKVTALNSEAGMKPVSTETNPTTQSGKVSENSGKESVESKESTAAASKHGTKSRVISSRFLSEPSKPSVKPQTSVVAPKVTEQVTVVKKAAETKENSQSADETGSEEAKEKTGQNLEESQTSAVAANTNTEMGKVETQASLEAKTEDQNNSNTKEENTVSEKDGEGDSKTEISSSVSPAEQFQTVDTAGEMTTKDTNESSKDSQADVSKEPETVNTSQATSEDTKVLDKESKLTKEESDDAQSEQKSTDTNTNTKNIAPTQKENATPEPAAVIETTPPSAEPKQQPKPTPSRYQSSTANVISSSNLRDDTKILLEQISANSQSRNESTAAKEAPVTDDEKEDEADKNAKRKKENELRSSLGQHKSSQDREKVLERIETIRKVRKVYSRFEL